MAVSCVCVWGLEQGFDMLTDVKKQRSCTRVIETELALDGNRWGHTNKNRCTFFQKKPLFAHQEQPLGQGLREEIGRELPVG